MTRVPQSDDFDAVVDLTPSPGNVPESAYALVKRTYTAREGRLLPAPPEPLRHDFRDDPGLARTGVPVGSDFWSYKRLTDVVVIGSAYAPGAKPTQRMEVSCLVGAHQKRIAVFGTRHIEWDKDGNARIGATERFTTMPIDAEHAYGGIDTRVPFPPLRSLMDVVAFAAEHPGAYPRNHVGRGYFVVPERFDGIELPNLENPHDLLTDERLVLGDPRRWGRQPIPWTFGWQPMHTFPRYVFFGARPRFPTPPEELTEVRLGVLGPEYERFLDTEPATPEEAAVHEAFADRYYQEASARMQHGPLVAGTPVRVTGMREDGAAVVFEVPAAPRLEIVIDRSPQPVAPIVSNLVIEPDLGRVSFTYCARTRELPRKLIPRLHADIALSLRVDGAAAANYVTPPVSRLGGGGTDRR